MPIICSSDIFSSLPVTIALWKDEESESEIIRFCDTLHIDHSAISGIKLQKRRKEMLIERLLLHHIFGTNITLAHSTNGAPLLADSDKNVSISHTNGYVVVVVSDLNIGIDIERTTEKVIRVRTKFLSEAEQKAIPADCISANLIAWTAKEALYKAIHVDGIDFANDETIDPSGLLNTPHSYSGTYCDRQFLLHSQCLSEYAITLTIEKTKQ